MRLTENLYVEHSEITEIISAIVPSYIGFALFIMNAWAFMLFGWDKICAESGRWRIAESTLLGIAFCGGSFGAYLGRAVFRHKTHKQPFSDNLFLIAVMHLAIAMFTAVYFIL